MQVHIDHKVVQKVKEQYSNSFEKFKKLIDENYLVFIYSVKLVVKKESPKFEQDFLDDMKNSLGVRPHGGVATNYYQYNILDEDTKKAAEIFLVAHLYDKISLTETFFDKITEQIKLFFELCIQQIPYAKKLLAKKSSKKGPLGSWAFPQNRKKDLLPFEKNTVIEDVLYVELEKHFNDSISISDEASLEMQKILSKKEYPDIFREPKVKTIYRGMSVGEEWLNTLLKSNQIDKSADYSGSLNLRFVFNPLYNTQGSTS
jgi:hypothetical protein